MLVGAKIYPSSIEPPIEHDSILIHDGRIAGLGSAASVEAPRSATVLDCKGLVITAGSHAIYVSQPTVVADLITGAAEGGTKNSA